MEVSHLPGKFAHLHGSYFFIIVPMALCLRMGLPAQRESPNGGGKCARESVFPVRTPESLRSAGGTAKCCFSGSEESGHPSISLKKKLPRIRGSGEIQGE